YSPEANFNGTDSFTFAVNDGELDSNIGTVTITITAVNDPPVAVGDAYTTAEDSPLTIAAPGVLANDSDVDQQILTVSLVSSTAHGTLALNADGSFTYIPGANYNGPDSFTYQASDGQIQTPAVTVTLTVTPVNDLPTGGSDSYSVVEGQTLTISAPGVLTNDSDLEGDSLTAILASPAAHGTVILNPDGSLSFTSTLGYDGTDSFTYIVSDGQGASAPVTVTLTIIAEKIFANGFENESLAEWTSNETDGGNLSVSSAAALVGGYGMQALINDNNAIYVTDDSPNAEKRYRARFYFDPNSITMAYGDAHTLLMTYAGTSAVVQLLDLRYSSGAYQIRTYTLNDMGTWSYTSWYTISDVPHYIEFDWQAASAAGANNGSLTLWIDGVQKASLTGLDNDTKVIDRVKLGAVANIDSGTRGIYYFDSFVSTRLSYIWLEGIAADFSANQTLGPKPLLVSFTNLTQPSDPSNIYLWDFGDGTTSSEPNPTHTYADYGSFTVRLTVSGSRGTDTETKIAYIQTPEQIFGSSFESGSLADWTSNVNDSGDLSVTNTAALVDSYGMQAIINDNNSIFVTDDTPNADWRYRARFYFDPNSITMANGDAHTLLMTYTGTSAVVQLLDFRYSSGAYQIRTYTLNDTGTWIYTSWYTISDAPHYIEFDWQAASAAGANNGSLTLWIDGLQKASLSGLDNDTKVIDRVKLGAVANLDTGTRGTYYFDAFQSGREYYIGPIP
ncbi:MAG: tandem-95 repeat protein, partial [Anaerolineaceae bacterium]|nr:tandem-95 repeat protein [Anaerolineaceae bacterium]